MFYHMYRAWPLLLLGGFVIPGVSGIDVYTPNEVVAVNGTDVKLKCTFTSSQQVSPQSVTISWNFRSLTSGAEESVFYYHEVAYPPDKGRFKGRAVWSGDISRRDASITLLEVPPTFNGTYICQVRNPPDVHGNNGELVLKVVNKASISDIAILAAVVGGACGAILIILGFVVAVKFYRKRKRDNDMEMHAEGYEKAEPISW
ncbi:myelin protein zero-like protein 2 [Xenentodon cancila]